MKESIRHDDHGNAIQCFNTGAYIDLYLHIAGQRRHIGCVNIKERVFETERMRKRHLHQKSNSYGFNHFLLKKTSHFDKVRIKETYGRKRIEYLVPVSVILEEGSYLFFLKEGFEKQIFLTLDRIKQFKI